jgi:hypothetical protein
VELVCLAGDVTDEGLESGVNGGGHHSSLCHYVCGAACAQACAPVT